MKIKKKKVKIINRVIDQEGICNACGFSSEMVEEFDNEQDQKSCPSCGSQDITNNISDEENE